MSFISVAAGQPIRATHVQQFTNWLTGLKLDTPGTVACTSTTEYALTVRSQDGGTGLALNVLYGTASSPSTIATFNKSQITLAVPVRVTGTTPMAFAQMAAPASGPAVGFTSLYAKTDGTLAYKAGTSTTENVVLTGTGGTYLTNPLTTTGDMIYSSNAATATRLAAGTARQALLMSAAATGPAWGESIQSLLTTTGDTLYASAANTPARLAKGTALQALIMSNAATGPEWAASLQSLLTTQGDMVYASAGNFPARLAKGTAYQELVMNGGATAPTWASGPLSLVQTSGDLVAGSAANAMTRVALGTKGHALLAGASIPTYEPLARRNRVINGCMRLAQRAMPTTDDAYCLDRWVLLLETASAATVSQETSDVPTDGSKRAMKLTVGAANNNKFGAVTILEFLDCADLRGKTVSLQAKLKATAAITDVRMAVLEWTSTADVVTSDVVGTWGSAGTNPTLASNWAYLGTPSNLSVTTSWATYKVEGLTVGTSANNLAVFIWCDDETTTATTDILRITDVQLEEGSICTQFERRHFAQEVNFAVRYYRKNIALGTSPATANQAQPYIVWTSTIANNAYYVDVSLDPPMRAAPTAVTFPYTTPANTGRSSDGAGTDYGASSASVPVTTAGRFAIQNLSGGDLTVSSNKLMHVGWTADAEL